MFHVKQWHLGVSRETLEKNGHGFHGLNADLFGGSLFREPAALTPALFVSCNTRSSRIPKLAA
jgi:hypothetical protein